MLITQKAKEELEAKILFLRGFGASEQIIEKLEKLVDSAQVIKDEKSQRR
jgi:acetolactate synthase small subunit